LPEQVRGYELIKEKSIAQVKKRAEELLSEFERQPTVAV
jgi:hypothetical protein